jgi:outer membrane biosynthesis protein TonB
MRTFIDALRKVGFPLERTHSFRTASGVVVLSMIGMAAPCQTPTAAPSPSAPPAPAQTTQAPATEPNAAASALATHADASPVPAKNPVLSQGAFTVQTVGGEIKEDQLKQLLVGKTLYLRAGYQDNNLEFDEQGRLQSHSSKASFTLSQIQINKVKVSKRKIEFEGDRYALHFLGAAPYEDPTAATDRVRITPKKKSLRLSFVREEVEKPKKKDKSENKKHKHQAKPQDAIKDTETASDQQPSTGSDISDSASPTAPGDHPSDKKGTLAKTEAQSSQLLLSALDTVFSVGIDERMIAAMPEFWKLYYRAAAEKIDYKPTDPGVLRQSAVDQKARLISAIDPPSNEFAQANGVAGMALYHAVIGSDGKVEEVVAGRPIGFGLDESAEQTIRKATFQAALKDGKPVPVALDLVVSFRIYSKRTSQPATAGAGLKPDAPALPGPYTAESETAQATTQKQ